MDDLLGFVVLSGPLLLIVIWVPVSIALAWWFSKKCIKKGSGLKIAVGLGVFLVVLLLPVSDEIAGHIYFNYLCKTMAGAKVYQTIELPAEYWNEDGSPTFYRNWDARLGKKYPLIYTNEDVSHVFHIENAGYKFMERESGDILGEVVNYRYWGGWVRRNLALNNSATSCPMDVKIITEIFVPAE